MKTLIFYSTCPLLPDSVLVVSGKLHYSVARSYVRPHKYKGLKYIEDIVFPYPTYFVDCPFVP